MSIDIHNHHDSFVKAALSNLEVAKDLLKAHLPSKIQKRIDWNSLEPTNKSYVDEQLKQLHSDVVYRCKVNGKEAYIYTLIEHQSKPETLLPFRMLEYNVRMLREHLSQGNKKLPLIVNLVLYSGKRTPYPYSVDLYDCFEEPDKARELIFKPLQLIDLGQISEEELAKHGSADLLELLLKQSRARTFLKWIQEHPEEVLKLLARHYGVSGIVYILQVENQYTGKEIEDAIVSIDPSKKETIMTAAEQIEKRGMQQGMLIGRQQGRQEEKLGIARNMLKEKEPKEKVLKWTGLAKEELDKLMKEVGLN